MFRKVRFYSFLFLCGFLLNLSLSTQRPAWSQSTPVTSVTPPEVSSCLPVAPLNTGVNQFEPLGSYSESGVNYFYLLVTPPKPVSEPEAQTDTPGGASDTPAVNDNTPLPINPWRLVISYTSSGCQVLTTPENQSLANLTQNVARQLELQRYQKVVQASGGLEAFKQSLFNFTNDPYHGNDVPEKVQIAPESAWALQQLGIKLPSHWSVSP